MFTTGIMQFIIIVVTQDYTKRNTLSIGRIYSSYENLKRKIVVLLMPKTDINVSALKLSNLYHT